MSDYLFLIVFAILAVVVVVVVGIKIKTSHKKSDAERSKQASIMKKQAEKRKQLAKSVKIIQWSDQYIVDQGIIDKDHQFLFTQINKFNMAIPALQTADQMMPLLISLQRYTQAHFAREEKLQLASGYIFHEDHQAEHKAMIDKLNGFVKKAEKAKNENLLEVVSEIGTFLQEWLTGHVIENDLTMTPYVDRIRENSAGMASLG